MKGNYYQEPYAKPNQVIELAKNDEIASNFWHLCASLSQELLGEELQ